MQHQQDQLKPLTIEEKISQVQQQSVSKAMDPNVANAPIDPNVANAPLDPNVANAPINPVTSFNQLQNQPIQTSNNDDSTNNEVNSQSMQHQQDQLKPPTIGEKISKVQQQSNGPVINSNSPGQPVHPTLEQFE